MELRFIVDANVGRLATWLRVMGYDASFVHGIGDNDLIRMALREQRVIVTRDRHIPRRRLVTQGHLRVALVTSDNLWDQLRQIVAQLGLVSQGSFTRCVECNAPLHDLSRDAVRERVPPYVFQTQQEFQECPVCRRVYWRGTHWANMRRELGRVRETAS